MTVSVFNRAASAIDRGMAFARDRRAAMAETPAERTIANSFAHWTERALSEPEAISARELSGLSDDELTALSEEFARAPRLERTDVFRFGIPAGALLCCAAALGALIHFLSIYQPGAPASNLLLVSMALGAIGLVAMCVGSLAAYGNVSTQMAYRKVGMYTGVLDERHPWLYKALLSLNHPAAERYREKVVIERGPLRGVDYLMMREIAEAQDNLDMTQSARTVARRLQHLPDTQATDASAAAVDSPATPPATEPKLVSVLR